MKYRITGADRTTGEDATHILEARSAGEAESIASLTLLVSGVEAADDPAAPKPLPVTYARRLERDPAAGVDWSSGLARQAKFLRWLSWPIAGIAAIQLLDMLVELVKSLAFWEPLFVFRFFRDAGPSRIGSIVYLATTAVLMRITAHAVLGFRAYMTRAR